MTLRSIAGDLRRRLRKKLRLWRVAFPRWHGCNLCGWRGRRMFSDAWHPYTVCPGCRSQVRHRLLAAVLTHSEHYGAGRLLRGKRVIHFAPEPVLSEVIRREAAEVVTADLVGEGVDLTLDLTDMGAVADGAFDVAIACDVLEHVPDDRAAMRELRRILAPGGTAVLTVPQGDGFRETYEDPDIVTPEARRRAFGQEDHVRMYGDDVADRLHLAGFEVDTVTEEAFDPEVVRHHVLFPPVLSSHPLATNHRRLYFARRPLCRAQDPA